MDTGDKRSPVRAMTTGAIRQRNDGLLLSRRSFLAASATSALVVKGTVTESSATTISARPGLMMIDESNEFALAFGQHWAAQWGSRQVRFRGDMTRAWLSNLHGRWDEESPAIGGVTSASSLFCFERLAWDAGRRVAWRKALHFEGADSPVWQWLITPRSTKMPLRGRA